MNKITNFFLNAKHWQLFTILLIIPMILIFVGMFSMIFSIKNNTLENPEDMFRFLRFFPILIIIPSISLYGWFWSIGTGLQKKIPDHLKMNVKRFKTVMTIPVVYMVILSVLLTYFFSNLTDFDTPPNPKVFFGIFMVIFPLHLVSICCLFYSMYFAAKTLKTVELQKEVSFTDCIAEFVLIWFHIIGVWILQPKINKMINNENLPLITDENIETQQ